MKKSSSVFKKTWSIRIRMKIKKK